MKQIAKMIITTTFVICASISIAQDLIDEEPQDVYKVYIRNLQVGELTFAHEIENGNYESKFSFKTKSLAGALFNLRFDGQSIGTGAQYGRYYSEKAVYKLDADDEVQSYNLNYQDGLLTKRLYDPRLYPDIDPETQQGAIDPLAAATYIFREAPFDHVCSLSVRTFDGLTANQVILGKAVMRKDGRYQCNGGIDRLAGYDEEAPGYVKSQYFTALYRLNRENGNYILDRLVGQSPYGQYRIVRK